MKAQRKTKYSYTNEQLEKARAKRYSKKYEYTDEQLEKARAKRILERYL